MIYQIKQSICEACGKPLSFETTSEIMLLLVDIPSFTPNGQPTMAGDV